MFSGIIKALGQVQDVSQFGTNKRVRIGSSISNDLRIDQSVAHDGVCLTVVETGDGYHVVDMVEETLSKTSFHAIQKGQWVNLERPIAVNTLLDGHLVQGHVDACIRCRQIKNQEGSWKFTFELPETFAALVILHGSVCINGVSLTVAALHKDSFEVAIIPYTYEHTTFRHLKEGDGVNVEFDLIGKYLKRLAEVQKTV